MPLSVAVGVEGRSMHIDTLDMSPTYAAGASGEDVVVCVFVCLQATGHNC